MPGWLFGKHKNKRIENAKQQVDNETQTSSHLGSSVQGSPDERLLPLPPEEPDYSQLKALNPLLWNEEFEIVPTLVIGLGQFGRKVLDQVVQMFELYGLRGDERLRLLALQVKEVEPLRGSRSSVSRRHDGPTSMLRVEEKIFLPLERDNIGQFHWYPQNRRFHSNDFIRPDGRLALYQDLGQINSLLWGRLSKLLMHFQGQGHLQVWMVGSVMDPVSTGLVFDLTHLLRLVSHHTRQNVFVGWLFAFPGKQSLSKDTEAGIAFLREWERLQEERERLYTFNESSDNAALRTHYGDGRNDNDCLFLVQHLPFNWQERQIREPHDFLRDLIASSLFALSAREIGENVIANIMEARTSQQGKAILGTLGVRIDYTPFETIQQILRRKIAFDVLFDRREGVLSYGAFNTEEVDLEGALYFLDSIGRPFFRSIVSKFNEPRYSQVVPPPGELDVLFRRYLRQRLQEYIDGDLVNGMKQSFAFLNGLEEVFQGVDIGNKEAIEILRAICREAIDSLRAWRRWRRSGERYFRPAKWSLSRRKNTESSFNVFWHPTINPTIVEQMDERLQGLDEIKRKVRAYIRWAWVISDNRIQLTLDTLIPNWSSKPANVWRHKPEKTERDLQHLYDGVIELVKIFADNVLRDAIRQQEGSLGHRAERAQEEESLPLRMVFSSGSMQADKTFCLGRNPVWLESVVPRYKSYTTPIIFERGPTSLGISFRCRFPIDFKSIDVVRQNGERYVRTGDPQILHIFPGEQRALTLEQLSIGRRLGYRRRQGLEDMLPPDIVHWLDDDKRWWQLQGLVGAWFEGLFQFDLERNAWVLYPSRRSSANGEQEPLMFISGEGSPLDAINQLFSQSMTQQKRLEEWLEYGRDALERASDTERYQKLHAVVSEGFRSKADLPKADLHWYILAVGLVNMVRSRHWRVH